MKSSHLDSLLLSANTQQRHKLPELPKGDSRKFTPGRFHFSPLLPTLLHFFEVETQNYELKQLHAFVCTHCAPKASEKRPSLPEPWLTVPLRTSASIPLDTYVLSTFLLPNYPLISSPLNPDSFQALSLHESNSSLVSRTGVRMKQENTEAGGWNVRVSPGTGLKPDL